ncbi:MAG TPA: FGGY family carbohydrate kinase [Spirochaetia bacterium]|nr:FGGY family carbohydrate kinase [Spirochaetia bacterium]
MRTVGIDLGTTKVAVLCVDTDSRTVVWTGSIDHQAHMAGKHQWEHLQDPEKIVRAVNELLRTALSKSGRVDAVAVTGQVHGILYLDSAARAVSPLMTWLDGRGAQQFDEKHTFSEHVAQVSGSFAAPGYGMVTHFYNLRNGLVPPSARSLATIISYVATRLAGLSHPVTDPTDAASLGLFDVVNHLYRSDPLRELGIPEHFLPRVVDWKERIGAMPDGTVVATAIGDNQAGFLSAVPNRKSMAMMSIGTSGQISVFSEQPDTLPGLELRPFPGGFLQVGATLSAGATLAALARFFEETVAAFGATPAADVYARMNSLAESAHGTDERPAVDPRFAGTRDDTTRRGAITGITLSGLTPANLTLGTVEGIVRELFDLYQRVPQRIRSLHTAVVGAGNGLRRNPMIRNAVERVFGQRLTVSSVREEAATGAALLAAVQAGAIAKVDNVGGFTLRPSEREDQ